MGKRTDSIKFLTRSELQRLLAAAREHSVRDYVMILLAYRHGLRCAEICEMKYDQVDCDAQRLLCVRRKGSVTNWQELVKDEVDAVTAWLPHRPFPDSQYMFVTCRGGPLNHSRFRRILKSIGVEAGVPHERAHPHALKHSIAVHMVEADIPVQLIQRRLGHRSIKNTMVYLSIADSHVDKVVKNARQDGYIV